MAASTATPGKKPASGGATFWPQLEPRPAYPGWATWARRTAVAYTRLPLLLTVAARTASPAYQEAVAALRKRGYGDATIFAMMTCGVHTVTYATCNGFFGVCDAFNLLPQHKMQAGKAQAPSATLKRKTLLEAALGQFVLAPLSALALFKLARRLGMPELTARLPGFASLFKAFAIAHFFNNFFFYWAHRLVHSKPLYSKIHKQHHNYIETIGIAAEYASPVEQVLANYIPTLGGVILFGRNPLIFLVWLVYRLEETYEAHSGYYFGETLLGKIGLTNAEHSAFHFSHHLQNRGNFGSWHMDYLFGTMDAWIAAGDTEGYVAKHLLPPADEERNPGRGGHSRS